MIEQKLKSINNNLEFIEYKSNGEWLEFRKLGIGGSDIASIIGQNRYRSSIDVWDSKINGSNFQGNNFTYWGHKLESVVAQEFQDKHQEFKVEIFEKTIKNGYSLANVDRVLVNENEELGILEVKTTNAFNNSDWSGEEVPQEYYCQVMHYLAVTGLEYAYLVVLIGGNNYKEFYIERNNQECEYLLKSAKEWWEDYILKNEPPEPDGTDSYSEFQKTKVDILENSEVLEIEEDYKVERYKKLEKILKETETEMKEIKQMWINEMIDKKSSKANIGNYKLSTVIQNRKKLDEKKLREDFPGLDKYYSTSQSAFFKLTGGK